MINGIGSISREFMVSNAQEANKPAQSQQLSSDFGTLMADMASSTVESMKNADTMAVQGITGEASTREVVDAVMQAEQALRTSIAIRDKIVTAYLETSRMAI